MFEVPPFARTQKSFVFCATDQ